MSVNYPVIYKAYTFVVWYLKKIEKLPKNHRYTLGEKIQNSALELILLLTETVYAKNKKEYLYKINKELEKLRILTRISGELSLLSEENTVYIFEQINDIGTQAGGWLKNV
jgi:hypothetical protein